MKRWLIRAVLFIVVLEIIYLGVVNLALNLPWTQTLINQSKPEKFTVHWDSGWTLYPFRVHAKGISANGQSRTQQWQVQAPAASASISLLPLIWHAVNLDDIEIEDVNYRQRRRPKADGGDSDIRAFFPPIEGRELKTPADAAPPPKKDKKAWAINIVDIHAGGHHEVWINQMQGKLEGELQTDLTFQTRGGPFSLSNGEVDIKLQSLILNGDRKVIRDGHIKGNVEFLPFVPKENKGLKILAFLNVDAEVRTETESLAFLNIYLTNFEGMKVDGAGLLQGRLHLRQGELQAGSDIKVSARKLSLDLLDKHVEGDGNISIEASDVEEETNAVIEFTNLEAFDSDSDVLLFSGDGLTVEAQGNRFIVPVNDKHFETKRLAVTIPAVEVSDLGVYQAYIPDKWAFKLHGGEGKLQGRVELTQTGFNSNLRLSSETADVGIKEYRFISNLDMALKIDSPAVASGIDISGTYIHLNGAKLSNEAQQSSKPWHATVDIEKGKLKLLLPEGVADDAGFRELYQGLKGKEIVTMLDSDDEEIKITGSISDLAWLSVLFKNRFGLAITGTGDVTADIVLSQGWLAPGTKLEIEPEALGVEVLDYAVEGDGEVTLMVEKGGEKPDMKLNVALDDALMRRKGEEQAFVENVTIKVQSLVRNMTFDGKSEDVDLHLQIPSAIVRDMSVYNQYLPQNSPMQLTGGKAELTADIKLTPDTVDGYVKLRTNGLAARIDEQEVSGELTADIALVDGVPENMDFDISGSSLRLDGVKVVGEQKKFRDEDWAARFGLTKARAVWKKPVRLNLEAELEMTDSMPIVSVIANKRGKHGWLGKALTIDDVSGEVRLQMADNQIVIPYAFADSDKIDVGAKGIISKESRNGVLYVRFHKLHGILKIKDGDRNIDILNAREQFDQYDTDAVLSK